MKLLPAALTLAAAVCLAAPAPAQNTFLDPANLRGERPSPLTGRELPIDQGASGLAQLLRKLNTRASLMNIVAHPDDEDGGMLTLVSRGLGARTVDLSLTRGEGGQNAMTGDFEDALGLLRTQELLACDRYSGVDQFFGTEVDFGFSKTKEESFAKWTHDRVLYDTVRAIRLYRPLVLTSTWIGGVTDGHGQHQVSGQIAQEAFLAAGDPKIFPDMIAEGILPWQPLRIYARVPEASITPRGLFDYATGQYIPARFTNYVTGETTTTPPTPDVTIHEGTLDPLLTAAGGNAPSGDTTPETYIQFARMGLSQQKSQIGPSGRTAPQGAFDIAYHLYGSRICGDPNSPDTTPQENDALILSGAKNLCVPPIAATSPRDSPADPVFFTGMDTSLEGIATLAPHDPGLRQNLAVIAQTINRAPDALQSKYPSNVVTPLSMALSMMDTLIHNIPTEKIPEIERANVLHELRIKRVQLNDALVLAMGLKLDATTDASEYVANAPITVKTVLTQETQFTVPDITESLANATQKTFGNPSVHKSEGLVTDQLSYETEITAGSKFTQTITRPYFSRKDIEQPVYQVEADLRLAPQSPPALIAWTEVGYGTVKIQIGRVVHNALQPTNIIPAASVLPQSHAQVLSNNQPSTVVSLRVHPVGVRVEAELPSDWKVTPDIEPQGSALGFKQLLLTHANSNRREMTLRAIAMPSGEEESSEGYRPVGYGDLPTTNLYTPATVRIVPADLTLPTRTRIAYLTGTGDPVPEALASIGLKPTVITVDDLTPTKLAAFDTVILGVRTYAAHPDLHGSPTQALLDFARVGGNVIVQYQTPEFTAADAPYPLNLGSNEKVVDETAPVTLLTPGRDGALAPDIALLSRPNKLSPADFNGWVEERGHGFLSTWDPRYTPLLETHDPGAPAEDVLPQSPQRGGLITVSLGKGRWTYCAFALYRQLPEAVPGAYRLFVNLLTP